MSDVMIEASGLSKRYGGAVALQNASFQLRRGEILGFLGPNGAGKSTTMKILTCFIAPTTGSATVNGCDIWEDPIGVREAIGYLPESTPLYKEMLVHEYLEWVAHMRGLMGETGNKRILKVVEQVGLEEVIAKSIGELSKGYKQRVGLAQALLHEPPILILDEPMSGLDPNQAVEIRALIKEIGKERTIMLSTHNLAEVQVTCQRVLIIDKGRIVADDTPEALARGGGGQRYRVAVLDGGAAPEDTFRKIEGVEGVRKLSSKDGEVRLEIASNTDDDLRPEIFRAAVAGDLVLVGLESRTQNLEQVFQNLTAGGWVNDADDEEDLDDEDEDLDDEDEDFDEGEDESQDEDDEEDASDEDDEDDEEEEDASEDEDEDDEDASDDDDEEKK